MMKKLILTVAVLGALSATAQRTDDPIEYFTDDKVSDTRFSVQAAYSPMYSFRRLAFYEPVTNGTELFNMLDEKGGGVYGQRYGMNFYYELNPTFHLGVGFNQEHGGFLSRSFAVFDQNALFQDTLGTFDAKTTYSSLNIPIQMVFQTQMTDIWALQVIPSYDLMFIQKLDRNWVGEGIPAYATGAADGVLGTLYQRGGDQTQYASGFNGSIGFALGSEFTIANNLALIVRGEFRLGLLPVSTGDAGLREVPYATGGMFGFRYYL
ncbi:MAG: hypothetical protein RL754_499 [Bacteroidota bacterium]|jgi:hypothetical protein